MSAQAGVLSPGEWKAWFHYASLLDGSKPALILQRGGTRESLPETLAARETRYPDRAHGWISPARRWCGGFCRVGSASPSLAIGGEAPPACKLDVQRLDPDAGDSWPRDRLGDRSGVLGGST